MNSCGEEAGAQNSDLTNRNYVERHEVRGKLAKDSEAQRGLKQLCVNVVGLEGKLSNLIRGDLQAILAEVSRSHSSRWSNAHPRRIVKIIYRAKGRTGQKLRNYVWENKMTAETRRYRDGRGRKAEGWR